MRVIGQDENGRIVIDGEGVYVHLDRSIPGDSPVFLTNFIFNNVGNNSHSGIDMSFNNPDPLPGPGFPIFFYENPSVKNKKEPEMHYESIKSRFDILDL